MNQVIKNLKPGQAARLSGDSTCWVTVERSGNGKLLRFVRHTQSSFVVFKTERI
jgi:hypothetical protein